MVLFLGTGVVALLQQLLHGTLIYAGCDQGQTADGHQHQQRADSGDIEQVAAAYAHGGEQRYGGQHTQHHAHGDEPGMGVLVFPLPLADHALHAVLRFKGFFLQEPVLLGFCTCPQKDAHGQRHQTQQHAQTDAAGGIFGDVEALHLAHAGQQQQRHRGDDAQQHGEGHLGCGGPPAGQVVGGLAHGHAAQGRVAVLGRGAGGFLLQLVLQQEVGGDTEQAAHHHDLIHIGHGLCALPFGYGLAGDAQLLGQVLLAPACLFPQGHDLVS